MAPEKGGHLFCESRNLEDETHPLPEVPSNYPVYPLMSHLQQARELAMLICTSEEAIETFISHRDVAASDLLLPMAMS
jgi:hypothetical protein